MKKGNDMYCTNFINESDFFAILKYFGASSFGAGIGILIVYILKKCFDNSLLKDLEKKKSDYLYENNRKLKIDEEISKWRNPVLSSINGIIGRFTDIVNNNKYSQLKKNQDYYWISTCYYFAQYLCWMQLIKEEINYNLLKDSTTQETFLERIKKIRDLLQDQNKQTPIFSLQQRNIAEIMIVNENSKRTCMSYTDFIEQYSDENSKLSKAFKPLDEFISNQSQLNNELKPIITKLEELKDSAKNFFN